MQKLNIHKVGLVVGSFFGLAHLGLAVMVALGLAGRLITFALGMHFLSVPVTVLPFSYAGGLGLVVLASVIGYVDGVIFATIWNKVGVK